MLAIFPFKSGSTQLRISKPTQEHFRGFPEFPNQNLRQIGQGCRIIGHTNNQTDKLVLQHYIY